MGTIDDKLREQIRNADRGLFTTTSPTTPTTASRKLTTLDQGDENWGALEAVARGAQELILGGAYSFAKTWTVGGLGWLDHHLTGGTLEKWSGADRDTFLSMVGSGVGGALGFMGPMGFGRALTSLGVRGLSKFGTKAVAKGLENTLVRGGKVRVFDDVAGKWTTETTEGILKDKGFLQYVKDYEKTLKSKISPAEIENLAKGLVSAPVGTIGQMGKTGFLGMGKYNDPLNKALSSSKLRKEWIKDFNTNFPLHFSEQLARIAKKTGVEGFKLTDDMTRGIIGETKAVLGGHEKWSFPMYTLHQRLARFFRDGKLGNLAASAAEEAALFAGASLPMAYIESTYDEERPFDAWGTFSHSVLLGSMLGLIRYIPGGKDQPIVRSAYNRIKGSLGRKKKYSSYNVAVKSERDVLHLHAARMFEQSDRSLSQVLRDINMGKITGADKLKDLFEGVGWKAAKYKSKEEAQIKGAQQVKEWLTSVEKQWTNVWWKDWVRESGKDLWQSSRRWGAGSLAFNFDMFLNKDQWAMVPLDEKIFHFTLGAYMSKRGRRLEYVHKGKHVEAGNEVPYTFSTGPGGNGRFEAVDKYLNLLGMKTNSKEFMEILESERVLRQGGKPNLDDDGMQQLLKIAKDNGMIVDAAETRGVDPKLKDTEDDLYNTLKSIIQQNFLDSTNQRVLDRGELSKDQYDAIKKSLNDSHFDGVRKWAKPEASGMIKSNVQTGEDLRDIYYNSTKPSSDKLGAIEKSAVVDLYNLVLRAEWINKGRLGEEPVPVSNVGRPDLRQIRFTLDANVGDRDYWLQDAQRAMERLDFYGKISINKDVDPVYIDKETAFKAVAENGVLDSAAKKITEYVYGEAETQDMSRLITVGNNVMAQWQNSNEFVSATRRHYDMLFQKDVLGTNDSGEWIRREMKNGSETHDGVNVQKLITDIFSVKGVDGIVENMIASVVRIKDNMNKETGYSDTNSRESRFVRALQSVLKHNPDYKSSSYLTGTTYAEVEIAKVKELIKLLEKNGLTGFSKGNREDVELFTGSLIGYGFGKKLRDLSYSDGRPLDGIGMNQLAYLVDQNIVTSNFEILDIRGVIRDSMGDQSVSIFAINNKDIRKFVDRLSRGNADEIKRSIDMIDVNSRQILEKAAKRSGMAFADYVTNFFDNYQKIIHSMMKSEDGNGFLKPVTQGKVTAEYIVTLSQALNNMTPFGEYSNWKQLSDHIAKIEPEIQNKTHKKFLKRVNNIFASNPRNVGPLIDILRRHDLYDLKTKEIHFIGTPKDIDAKIKEVQKVLEWSFNTVSNSEAIKNTAKMQKEYFESNDLSDNTYTMSVQDYVVKYDLPYKAGLGETITDVFRWKIEELGNFDKFTKAMVKGITIKDGDKKYNKDNWKDLPSDLLNQFEADTIKVFYAIHSSQVIKRLHVGGRGVSFEPETVGHNELLNVLREIHPDLANIVDAKFETGSGIVNVRQHPEAEKHLVNLLESLALNYTATSYLDKEPIPGMGVEVSPMGRHYMAFIGNLGYGIAIPIEHRNLIVTEFAKIIAESSPEHQILLNRIFADIKKRIKKVDVENDDGTGSKTRYYEYQYLTPKSAHADMSMMITHIFGVKTIGKHDPGEWWKEVEKAGPINAKLLSRLKLLSNQSSHQITHEFLGQVIKSYSDKSSPLWRGEEWYNDVGKGEVELMKRLNKKGLSTQLVEDEGAGNIIQKAFSVLDSYENQRKQELENAHGEFKSDLDSMINSEFESKDLDGHGAVRKLTDGHGGLLDSSKANSFTIVSSPVMRILRLLIGANRADDIRYIKPIITNLGEFLLIGKTVFASAEVMGMEGYMKKNGVDMLMFKSASKRESSSIRDKVINLTDRNISSLADFKKLDNTKGDSFDISIDGLNLLAAQRPEHDATIPNHFLSGLTGPETIIAYNWLYRAGANKFLDIAHRTSGAASIDEINALALSTTRKIDDKYETSAGVYNAYIEAGGYPDPVFSNIYKNNVKRMHIENAGLITAKNRYGAQSVLIPDLDIFGRAESEYLLGTTFHNGKISDEMKRNGMDIYTYGQASISLSVNKMGNAVREFDTQGNPTSLMVIERRSDGPDKLVKWETARHGKLNETDGIFDAHSTLKGKNVNWEIAMVVHRTPSTRISDRVIVGIKDFKNYGNGVKLNSYDAVARLEADYDVDKLNYWWDTPPELVERWKRFSGTVRSVNTYDVAKTSVSDLDWGDPESYVAYNRQFAKSERLRGTLVKSLRMIDFLSHYNGYYKHYRHDNYEGREMPLGFNISDRGNGRIVFNRENLPDIQKLIARDIQRIIDSAGGYNEGELNESWERKILFGEKDTEYKGLFKREVLKPGKSGNESDAWDAVSPNLWGDVLAQDIVYMATRPYSKLLQLGTDVWEQGQSRKPSYDDMVRYVDYIYKPAIRNLGHYVYRRLKRNFTDEKGYTASDLNSYFQDISGKFIDIFKLHSARLDRLEPGKDVKDQLEGLLPFDRVMFMVAGSDRLAIDGNRATKFYGDDEARFESWYDRYWMTEGDQAAFQTIMNGMKKGITAFRFLNHVDTRISKLVDIKNSMQANGSINFANDLRQDIIEHETLRDRINNSMLTDENTGFIIARTIRRNIHDQIRFNRKLTINGFSYDKELRGKSPEQINVWLEKNDKMIWNWIWDNKKRQFNVKIRGLSDPQYLSTMVWDSVIGEISKDLVLDPSKFGMELSQRFDMEVYEARDWYNSQWSQKFDNRSKRKINPYLNENVIMNRMQQYLDSKYQYWENVQGGLGRIFIYKFMQPEVDPFTFTYFNNKLMPGYTEITPKYRKMGMRFLWNTHQLHDVTKKALIGEIATSVTSAYRGFYGSNYQPFKGWEDPNVLLNDVFLRSSADQRAREGQSPFYEVMEKLTDPSIEIEAIDTFNPEVKQLIGMMDSRTLEYISLHAPPSMEFMGSLKQIMEMEYFPRAGITSQGNLLSIGTAQDYWIAKIKGARAFFGESANRGILTRSPVPRISMETGERPRNYESAKTMKSKAEKWIKCTMKGGY